MRGGGRGSLGVRLHSTIPGLAKSTLYMGLDMVGDLALVLLVGRPKNPKHPGGFLPDLQGNKGIINSILYLPELALTLI